MKKKSFKFLAIAVCILSTLSASAQRRSDAKKSTGSQKSTGSKRTSSAKKSFGDAPFEEGTSVIQANLGLGGGFGLPVQFSYEYGYKDKVGIGGIVGYGSTTDGIYSYSYSLFAARVNYHIQVAEKLDTYFGLSLGYASATVKPAFVGNTGSSIILGGQLGGRYYFTEKLAGSVELGYGMGYLNIGIAYKLK
jgi:hypothetical protein